MLANVRVAAWRLTAAIGRIWELRRVAALAFRSGALGDYAKVERAKGKAPVTNCSRESFNAFA